VTNVIPATASAMFNIRFNTEHTQETLQGWLDEHFNRIATTFKVQFEINWKSNADPFVTEAGTLTQLLSTAIKAQTGRIAELSTTGGTSDARFITQLCPVAEFGLVGKTMHQIDENVLVDDIDILANIYEDMLHRFDANNEY
jgi:succinyl-diaminopimelate desuccinylase